jgi:hypothetical protein
MQIDLTPALERIEEIINSLIAALPNLVLRI